MLPPFFAALGPAFWTKTCKKLTQAMHFYQCASLKCHKLPTCERFLFSLFEYWPLEKGVLILVIGNTERKKT